MFLKQIKIPMQAKDIMCKLNFNEVSLYDTVRALITDTAVTSQPCNEDIYFNPAQNEHDLYSQLLTQINVSDIPRELLMYEKFLLVHRILCLSL